MSMSVLVSMPVSSPLAFHFLRLIQSTLFNLLLICKMFPAIADEFRFSHCPSLGLFLFLLGL